MAKEPSRIHRRARCHPASNIWHFRPECSDWPIAVYAAEDLVPGGGVACVECTGVENGEQIREAA